MEACKQYAPNGGEHGQGRPGDAGKDAADRQVHARQRRRDFPDPTRRRDRRSTADKLGHRTRTTRPSTGRGEGLRAVRARATPDRVHRDGRRTDDGRRDRGPRECWPGSPALPRSARRWPRPPWLGRAAGRGGDDGAERGATPPATAEVTRQTLVDTESRDGELGYGDTTAVAGRLHRHGDLAARRRRRRSRRGKPLYRVDDDPVRAAVRRRCPRTGRCRAGRRGRGRQAVRENLWALGYTGFTVDGDVHLGHGHAVGEWQEDLGLGGDRHGRARPGRLRARAGPGRRARGGDRATPAQPGAGCSSYTGTARVATVELDVADQRLAARARPCAVTLPGRHDRRRAGSPTSSTVVEPGRRARRRPHRPARGDRRACGREGAGRLDQAAVDVAFTAARAQGRADRAGRGAARAAPRAATASRSSRAARTPHRRGARPACSPTAGSRSAGDGLAEGMTRGDAVMTTVIELRRRRPRRTPAGCTALRRRRPGRRATASWWRSSARPARASRRCCT